MTNLRNAVRQLIHHPWLTGCIVLLLALGVGATTTIFSVFHQVLVRPLPVPAPERLVNIVLTGTGSDRGREAVSYPMFRDLEAARLTSIDIAGYSPLPTHLSYQGKAARVSGMLISGGYFTALELQPALGRLIGPADEPRLGEAPVVVISHAFWQSRFGGDPKVIGKLVMVNNIPLTIIGVAPERFAGTMLGERTQVFVPLTLRTLVDPTFPPEFMNNRNMNWTFAFTRLRPGVAPDQASVDLNSEYRRIRNEKERPPETATAEELARFAQQGLALVPGARGWGEIPGAAESLTLLLAITLLVLAIVSVNVANLLLARGATRTGEMAIREAIGASRSRLIAQLLTEAALPAGMGGVLSVPVAMALLEGIATQLPAGMVADLGLRISPEALVCAALTTVATTVLCGLLPALKVSRTNLLPALKGFASPMHSGTIRGVLAMFQVGVAMVLLVLAGLFARSLLNVTRVDLGIDVDALVSFSISPRLNGYDPARTAVLYDRIVQELAVQPGVAGISYSSMPVITGGEFMFNLFVEGFGDGTEHVEARFNLIGPGYFQTLSTPLRAGREFTADDMNGPARVAIVNERFTQEYGLGPQALGKQLSTGGAAGDTAGERFEIIGIVANSAYSKVKDGAPPQFFLPIGRPDRGEPFLFSTGALTFYVDAAIEPDAVAPTIARVIAAIDPTLPVNHVTTLRRQVWDNVVIDRLVAVLSAGFAGLAALLTAIGLYGVLSYNVARRTRELGLRLALGARPGALRALVLRQVAVIAAIGIALGLIAAVGLGRVAASLLYGISGHDPSMLATAAALLSVVILSAAHFPARRAARIDPMQALREE